MLLSLWLVRMDLNCEALTLTTAHLQNLELSTTDLQSLPAHCRYYIHLQGDHIPGDQGHGLDVSGQEETEYFLKYERICKDKTASSVCN